MAYSVLLRVLIHNVTYSYCATVSRVKCVACGKLLVSVVLLILELSVGVGRVGVEFCTSVCFCFCSFFGNCEI